MIDHGTIRVKRSRRSLQYALVSPVSGCNNCSIQINEITRTKPENVGQVKRSLQVVGGPSVVSGIARLKTLSTQAELHVWLNSWNPGGRFDPKSVKSVKSVLICG